MLAIPDEGQRTELETDAGGGVDGDGQNGDFVADESLMLTPEPGGHTRVGTHEHTAAVEVADDEYTKNLTDDERALLGDLFAVVTEHADEGTSELDRRAVEQAFAFACDRHADQRRRSGEDFITHPVEVAKICAGLRLDTETLCAALLHDTVEDTSASLDEVRELFGDADRRPGRRRDQADRDHVPEP